MVDTVLDDLDSLMEKHEIDGLIAVGNAFDTADIFWLTGFRSTDQITYVKNRGEAPVVASFFNTLERVVKESRIKKTHDLSEIYIRLMKEGKSARDNIDVFVEDTMKSVFTGKIVGVPDHLPAERLVIIQNMGYEVKVVPNLLKDARATKSAAEIDAIKKAGDATVGGITRLLEMVKDSDIGPNKTLTYEGEALTVGRMKLALDHFLLDHGAEAAMDTILAVGTRAFDWHYLGAPEDELKADEPTILDVFPRLKQDRYVADVTRTFVKGSVSKKLCDMFESVQVAAGAAIDTMKDGAKIDDVNMACYESLKRSGYDSRRLNPETTEGMTHGLGHGIGLEVHENPSMYDRVSHFKSGQVMAIEPGVYLKELGGVRIENDYLVSTDRAVLLTEGLDEILYL
ncbi:MAG: M24 family metallopeptidase [Candidatus Thorarchaeota archaeon]|jgi:Xaa-Pro aminopeptidase